MRNTKKSLFNIVKKECTKKVRICTMKFCAIGCLIDNYEDDDIVCLENVDMVFTDGCRDVEHRESLCVCDDHIIAFEAIKENK
ncbi:MAG: hypothetical protein LUG16_07720 [Candidatus Gastranaerophilales bacterium]|nr:hypothetical protein [Candidatus Gastranaerophilales bacterium]